VEEAFNLFFEHRKKMVDLGELELSTYEDYLAIYRSRFIKNNPILKLKVKNLKLRDAQKFVDGLYQLRSLKEGREGEKLSVNTLNNPFKLVHVMFEFLRKDIKIIGVNPFTDVKNKPLYKPKNQKYLISDEIKIVLDALNKENIRFKAFINLFLETGLRIEEITAIKYSDLNSVRTTLQIKRALIKSKVTGTLIIKDVKTEGSEREMYISKYTFSLINNLRKFREDAGFIVSNDDFIFTSWKDNELIGPNKYAEEWRTFTKKIGFQDLPLKNLRHSVATFMLQGETNLKAVKKRFGWSKDSTVFNIYNQSSLYEDKKLVEKFEKEFRNTFGLNVLDLYKIYSGRFKNKFKLTKFIEDITRVEVDENNYNELYDKCKNYLSELYPIFNKILIIDNMIDDEEIDAMLMGFNELYNDIKLEPLEDVEMSIKI